MDKKRRNEIAYQLVLIKMKKDSSFRTIENLKREIGNLVKEEELSEKKISKEELEKFCKEAYIEVFDRLIQKL